MTYRGVDWPAVLAGTAVGAAILLVCVIVSSDGPPLTYVRLALIALAAAAAFVLDDPSAEAVDAVPVPLRRRTAVRASAASVPFAVWVAGILALEVRSSVTPLAALLVEGGGVIVAGVALSTALRRAGRWEPGELTATCLGSGALAALLFDPAPRSVPLFPSGHGWSASTALWACVTAAAVAVVVVASRDRYRPGRDSWFSVVARSAGSDETGAHRPGPGGSRHVPRSAGPRHRRHR